MKEKKQKARNKYIWIAKIDAKDIYDDIDLDVCRRHLKVQMKKKDNAKKM